MRKDRTQRKRFWARVISVVIVVSMLLGVILPFVTPVLVRAEEVSENSGIEITGEIGFDGKYKVYTNTPVKVHVVNNGENFKGELQIKVNIADQGYGVIAEPIVRNNIYAYPLELPKGASKVVEMETMPISINKTFEIVLVDEAGKTVQTVNFPGKAVRPNTPMIGVLSDDFNSLSYIRQFKLNNYTGEPVAKELGEMLVQLNEKNFPLKANLLQAFNAIVINDFDTSLLSIEMRKAIEEWVNSGGRLFIGAGANLNKVLKGFSSDFVSATEKGTASVSDLNTINPAIPFIKDISTPINVSVLDVKDATILHTAGETPLIHSVNRGSGTIVIFGFDIGKEPIISLNKQPPFFLEGFLTMAVEQTINNYGMDYMYSNIEYMLGNLPSLNEASLYIIFVVVILYAVIAGPILYLVLKRKDKREQGFIIIPVTAVVVLVAVFFISSGSKYKKPIVNSISKLSVSEGSDAAAVKASVGVMSPKGGDIKVTFDESLPISLSSQQYYDYKYSTYVSGNNEAQDLAKLLYTEPNQLTYFDKSYWDMSTFKTDFNYDLGGTLDANVYFENDRLKGTITNNTNLDLQDVIVGFQNIYSKYPSLKKGETIQLDQNFKMEYKEDENGNQIPVGGQSIYDIFINQTNGGGDPLKGIPVEQRRELQLKQQLMQSIAEGSRVAYSYSYPTTYMGSGGVIMAAPSAGLMGNGGARGNGVTIYAFSNDNVLDDGLYVNKTQPYMCGTNMLEMNLTSSLIKEGEFELPLGIFYPSEIVSDVGYSMYEQSRIDVFEDGFIQLNYKLEDGITLSEIKFDTTSLDPATEIFNAVTNKWEKLGEIKNAQSYVNRENTIQLRVKVAKGTVVMCPSIAIKGTKESSK